MNRRRTPELHTEMRFPRLWLLTWLIVAIAAAVIISSEAEAQTWQVLPQTGAHTVVVDPSGNHHVIITSPSHGYGYGLGQQPGWNQYPNPVDSFLTNYLRAQQQGMQLRSREIWRQE